jgi:hypothetical protein
MQQGHPRDPLQLHREWCRGIEAAARAKAGRALTADERDKIWNCGSFHFLEILERDVTACQTPAELERCLAAFPFLGPLPPEYTAHDWRLLQDRHAMHQPLRRPRAIAIIELPLVICLFIAVAGIVAGAILWYRSGSMTTGVLLRFSLVLPLLALVALVLLSGRRERRRSE